MACGDIAVVDPGEPHEADLVDTGILRVLNYIYEPGGISRPPELWYRADSYVQSDGSDILTDWTDKGPNHLDAAHTFGGTPATFQTDEINGQPVLRAVGGAYFETILGAGAKSYTVFFVGTTESLPQTYAYPWFLSKPSGEYLGSTIDGSLIYDYINTDGSDSEAYRPRVPFGTPFLQICELDVDASQEALLALNKETLGNYQVGGVNTTAMPDGATLGLLSGPSRTFHGDIAEFVIYKPKLSIADREAVRAYLIDRYNFPDRDDFSVDSLASYNAEIRPKSDWSIASGLCGTEEFGGGVLYRNDWSSKVDARVKCRKDYAPWNAGIVLRKSDGTGLSFGTPIGGSWVLNRFDSGGTFTPLFTQGGLGSGPNADNLYRLELQKLGNVVKMRGYNDSNTLLQEKTYTLTGADATNLGAGVSVVPGLWSNHASNPGHFDWLEWGDPI